MGAFKITAEKGTRDSRALFTPPERVTAESLEEKVDQLADLIESDEDWERRKQGYELVAHVRVSFQYIDNDTHDAWEDRANAVNLEERERVRKLKESHSESEWPALYRVGYRTSERREAGKQHAREYLDEVKVGLEGVELGDRRSEDLTTQEVIELMIRMRWHQQAVGVIHRAQVPTVEQFLS